MILPFSRMIVVVENLFLSISSAKCSVSYRSLLDDLCANISPCFLITLKEIADFLRLQSFTKYSRQTLVFVWNRWRVNFLFFREFLLVLTKLSFREEDWALGNNSMKFWDLPDISQFPKILSLKSFGNSCDNWYILV